MGAQAVERRLLALLQAAEAASPAGAVAAVTDGLAEAFQALEVTFLIADLSGRALVRLSVASAPAAGPAAPDQGRRHRGRDVAEVLPFDGGPHETALRSQRVAVRRTGDGWQVLAPVTERGEALGLLELLLPAEPAPEVVDEIVRTTLALAFVVIANRRHTDYFEWGQRTAQPTLSAEIQRRLLPGAFTCEAAQFTLAGWLEPAGSVAGDTFDYSLDRDALHLSVTDAMGHGVGSALTATLCVSSLRNSRRHGVDLRTAAGLANTDVHDQDRDGVTFATGVLGRVELATGVLAVVNGGHVPPLLVRDGRVAALELPVDLPFGILPGSRYRATEVQLRPGDRLLMITDGMLERGAALLDLPSAVLGLAGAHPREAVRYLSDAVLAVAGPVLDDDATLLLLDWHGDRRR